MKIKEVCEKTGLTDRAVRFYIENGLLCPHFTENYSGRKAYDFSDDDIETLKKITVYRKLGISVENINLIFSGSLDLQQAVKESAEALQNEVEMLNGSIELCKEVIKNHETNATFNQAYYIDRISADEREGKRFVNTLKDYAVFEKDVFYRFFQPFTALGTTVNLEKLSKKSKLAVIAFMIFTCVCSGFAGKYLWQFGFMTGFFRPFFLFVFLSLLFLPYYILKDRSEKGVRIWLYSVLVLFAIGIIVMVAFAVFLIVQLVLNISTGA